jgi:beta-glucosidase
MHSHQGLLTDVLKGELGFRGFVVSDWMGIDQIAPAYDDCVSTAINAGVDMVMVPEDYRRFLDTLSSVVEDGRVPMSRIDDAVRRILIAKATAGLFEDQLEAPPLDVIGSVDHRALAAEAVRRSAVLLKNSDVVPVAAGAIEVAGAAADDIGLQCGGWTVGWQGDTGPITSGTTLLDGLRADNRWDIRFDRDGAFSDQATAPIGFVCIAEKPYAEGVGDTAHPTASDEDRATFARMRARSERLVLIIYSGRPLVIPDLIDQADAVIAAWLPGSEGAALADVLAGTRPFEGRTPQPWPRSLAGLEDPDTDPLFPTGHGLRR